MKKLTLFSSLLVLFLLAAPSNAQAQTSIEVGPNLGLQLGDDLQSDFYVGAEARIGTPTLPVKINPKFEYYFVEDTDVLGTTVSNTFFTVGANALYEIEMDNDAFAPYAGGGLLIARSSSEAGGQSTSSTDFGIDFAGGATFAAGNLKPFVQANLSIIFVDPENATLFGITGGLLFDL